MQFFSSNCSQLSSIHRRLPVKSEIHFRSDKSDRTGSVTFLRLFLSASIIPLRFTSSLKRSDLYWTVEIYSDTSIDLRQLERYTAQASIKQRGKCDWIFALNESDFVNRSQTSHSHSLTDKKCLRLVAVFPNRLQISTSLFTFLLFYHTVPDKIKRYLSTCETGFGLLLLLWFNSLLRITNSLYLCQLFFTNWVQFPNWDSVNYLLENKCIFLQV